VALHAGRPPACSKRSVFLQDRRRHSRSGRPDRHQALPLFLLSGEYDYSCTPEETLAVRRQIPGTEVTIMKGSPFPMSENPEAFIGHLMPVLKDQEAAPRMRPVTKARIAGEIAGPRTVDGAELGDGWRARLPSISRATPHPANPHQNPDDADTPSETTQCHGPSRDSPRRSGGFFLNLARHAAGDIDGTVAKVVESGVPRK